MKHYLKYISNILGHEAFEKYEACRDKPLSKTITIVDSQTNLQDAKYIYDLVINTSVELSDPNIYITNHYKAIHDHKKGGLGNNIYHKAGFFYIQETSASLPASLFDIKSGDVVLDMCASPGGKSVQLANILSKLSGGILVSNEFDRNRQKTLTENIYKYGFANDIIISHDAKYIGDNLSQIFDHILVDAPCSGEGTCHKDTKFLNHRSLDLVNKTAKLQFDILVNIYKSLKPGGSMIYSTCTINPIENEGVVASFLAEFKDIKLVDLSVLGIGSGFAGYGLSDLNAKKVIRLLPHLNNTGGFFVAKFIKHVKDTKINNINNGDSLTENNSKVIDHFLAYTYDKFGIKSHKGYFYYKEEHIYYCNFGEKNDLAKKLSNNIYKSKPGIIIAKTNHKGYILTHAFAKIFGKYATNCLVKIYDIDKITKLFSDGILDNVDINIVGDNCVDNQYIYVKSDSIDDIYIGIGKVLPNGLKFSI